MNKEPLESNEYCEYVYDGKDTDGTVWYLCTIHNEMALSDLAPCSGYIEDKYIKKEDL